MCCGREGGIKVELEKGVLAERGLQGRSQCWGVNAVDVVDNGCNEGGSRVCCWGVTNIVKNIHSWMDMQLWVCAS